MHKLSEMEVEIHQLAESKYVNFRPCLETSDSLSCKVIEVQDEISLLEKKINNEVKGQLSMSTGEFQNLNKELTGTKSILVGLNYVAEIYDLLQACDAAIESGKYGSAAMSLNKLEELFKQPPCDQHEKLHILQAMKTELTVQRGKLECLLSDLWKNHVKWNIQTNEKSGSQREDGQTSLQEVSVTFAPVAELQELVQGLNASKLLQRRFKTFAEKFQQYLVPMVLEYGSLTVDVRTTELTQTLVVCPLEQKSDSKSAKNKSKSQPENKMYISVFVTLLEVLEKLNPLFLNIDVKCLDDTEPEASQADGKSVTLMSMLGSEVATWLLDLLQTTVLAKAIPTSAKDLDGFNEVISATKLLQDQLLGLGLIQPENQTLIDHVKNINMLFANKKSQTVLESSRDLMMSNLLDSVLVTDDKPVGEWPPLVPGGVKKTKKIEIPAEHRLSDNTFRMPRCQISQSIETLMRLAYETLSEATESSSECAIQMFYAVRSMFEMFLIVVPTHHGQSLLTVPQASALHHNNCMYIAHHLMTLGHQFAPKLPDTIVPTFVDLIQQMRKSGVEVFVAQVSRQTGLLLECLDGADGFTNVEEQANEEKASRSVRQVVLQMEHLHKIWKPVLPLNIYKKAMGKLIQTVVERVTDCVSALEDISQDAANKLISILSLLEDSCGKFMTSPGEATNAELVRHVSNWSRLTEMKLVLDSSLSEIGDRWSDGKGPLALAFTPIELKQLIRALFQNTERRANLLATIK
ncbi:centromere/kinetochore protein zw10 homolog [Physella acuta]|uniref:centromere/kinetochore protein zw10 homolog n=1 Tax=Physella acuta TaxID=109671 RepID=UPI0027DD0628|nr:centromere/kinetochore protein zw10 homolog [Physella acuta]